MNFFMNFEMVFVRIIHNNSSTIAFVWFAVSIETWISPIGFQTYAFAPKTLVPAKYVRNNKLTTC